MTRIAYLSVAVLTLTAIVTVMAPSVGNVKNEAAPLGRTVDAASTSQLAVQGNMPLLDGAVAWLNSKPLKVSDLRGKVVLVEFWTYTCINWRRQMPYVRAWAEKYRDKGLVVIGVHSPEFAFEKDLENVGRATKEIGVEYPVAVDSDHAIWRAFGNEYWPALYFVDTQGRVRHQQFRRGRLRAFRNS